MEGHVEPKYASFWNGKDQTRIYFPVKLQTSFKGEVQVTGSDGGNLDEEDIAHAHVALAKMKEQLEWAHRALAE